MLIKDHKKITKEDLKSASLIWDFLHITDDLQKADLIFVLCSHDTRVADYAVSLYKRNIASRILFSGGLNFFTKHIFPNSEAETFAEIAMDNGIPKEHIFIEKKSTNTGENIQFSKSLIQDYNFSINSIIAIQKPSMTLRIKLALLKQWSDIEVLISSPDYNLFDAPHSHINLFMIINEIVGDLQRIMIYPNLGFQTNMTIPGNIISAYNFLTSNGYNLHLANE